MNSLVIFQTANDFIDMQTLMLLLDNTRLPKAIVS